MIRQFFSRQFLVFLATGGTAALVNIGSRVVYSQWLDFRLAVVMAYLTGMATAFALARLLVFKDSQQSVQKSMFWFTLVNGVALAQTWVVTMVLADYLLPRWGVVQHVHEIAHVVGVVVPVFTSYLGHKKLSFK